MPNMFAYIVLFSWPLVVFVLFRRLPLPTALVWSLLGGYLFLPPDTGIDLPLLPVLNKTTIPSFAAAVMCWLHTRKDRLGSRGSSQRAGATNVSAMRKTILLCLALLFGTTVLTALNNTEAVISGPDFGLPGLKPYDVAAMLLNALVLVLPFFLARRYLSDHAAQITVLKALVAGGLVYSLLILIEVRLSPQLNYWFYGFYSHSFAQHIRGGGFRPMVFVEHGLRVGIFMAMAALAAATLWRLRAGGSALLASSKGTRSQARATLPSPGRMLAITLWLLATLFLSKTLGAFLIACLLLPVAFLLSPRSQAVCAAGIAAIVLVYPMLRGADLVPTDRLVSMAARINVDRAGSLEYRFENEDLLLDHANQKPLTGWGGWNRNRVFDIETGADLTVTDGTWIILMGTSGWLGYLARFGLLTLPVIVLLRRKKPDQATVGLALILAANLIDLLPNSGLTPLTWLLAGTLSVGVVRTAQNLAEPAKRRRAGRSIPDAARPIAAGRARDRPPPDRSKSATSRWTRVPTQD